MVTTNGSGAVTQVTREGVTTGYSRSVSGTTATTTVTDALSHVTTIVADLNISRPTSITDPLSHTTSFQYDGLGRLTQRTEPEGNVSQYSYDGRSNVTQVRRVAKTGSGLADIVATASFDTTCANPVTCNEPNSITDAKGNETDYTYDSTHGGVLSVTRPAPTSGATRPETRYTYTLDSGSGRYQLTATSQCQTLSSCAGTADEVKSTISYDANGNVTSVTKGAGDNSLVATETRTYDPVGNLLTVDGPLPGSADTTRYRYDSARELIGVTGPDPDGAGSLKMRAVRSSYTNGLLVKTEVGTVTDQSDTAWSAFSTAEQIEIAYDANARPITQKLSSGGTNYALSQFSYDSLGRSDCVAVRMNPTIYGSLPTSACTLGTAGSFGNDRITQTVYDAASEPTQFKEAVGTSDAATERTLTYSNNGKLATLLDGESNLTTYEYDGFDRLSKTRYPSTTKGSGTSSTTDYEQLTYDANGNVTSKRLRDGNSIGFTYDNLNRVTLKDLPGSEPDVAYTYDLLGRQLTAKFSSSGLGITNAYDALGRVTSSGSNVDGTARTMSSQYDLAGDRTSLTGNIAGYSATFNYDVLGRMTAYVGEVGIGYDNLGHRTSMSMGTSGSSTVAYGYDGVDRLTSLTHDLAGTSADQALTFGYTPSSQIASRTSSNDSYAFTGHADQNVATTTNGLNQATAVGSSSLAYDARGNLTSDGSNTYVYDSENRLTSVSGAHSATLSYDPLGRLWQVSSPSGTTRFIYDRDHDVIETDGSGNALRSFVWGPGADEPLVWWEGANPKMLHADERGSTVSVADSSGNLVGINTYDEYGNPASTNTGRFQYTGQAWLSELGLYYYKARMYSPALGRFLQADPAGYAAGPNRYEAMGGDPVNSADPSGMENDAVDQRIVQEIPRIDSPDLTLTGWRSSDWMGMYATSVMGFFDEQALDRLDLAADALEKMSSETGISPGCLLSAACTNLIVGLNGKGYIPQTTDYFLLGATIQGEASGHPSAYAAVGWSIVNRVGDPHYSNTLAGVIFQPGQFDAIKHSLFNEAYYHFGLNFNPVEERAFVQTQMVANSILSGRIPDPTNGAMHFFSGPPTVSWEFQMPVSLQIGKGPNSFTFGP
jgi:RHS repeat-associated protein